MDMRMDSNWNDARSFSSDLKKQAELSNTLFAGNLLQISTVLDPQPTD